MFAGQLGWGRTALLKRSVVQMPGSSVEVKQHFSSSKGRSGSTVGTLLWSDCWPGGQVFLHSANGHVGPLQLKRSVGQLSRCAGRAGRCSCTRQRVAQGPFSSKGRSGSSVDVTQAGKLLLGSRPGRTPLSSKGRSGSTVKQDSPYSVFSSKGRSGSSVDVKQVGRLPLGLTTLFGGRPFTELTAKVWSGGADSSPSDFC